MRNTVAYSITKNLLCFVRHGEPDKCQEDFDCRCYHLDNSFSHENECANQQKKICYNIYSKAVPRLNSIFKKGVPLSQQPWAGSGTPETELTYTSNITSDIADWHIRSVGVLIITLSSKPTRNSASYEHKSSLSIRNQILQSIAAVKKYTINVTGIQQK